MSREDGIYWDCQCPVFNGCERVGEPCRNCWARGFVHRFASNPNETLYARFTGLVERDIDDEGAYLDWTGRTSFDIGPLIKLARVRKPKVVAFSWYGDWMYKPDDENLFKSFCYMGAPHTYLTLTKRPGELYRLSGYNPQPNVWLGVTAWNQESYNNACKYLSALPGWHTWISLEPMLSPVDITQSDFKPSWIVCGCETGRGAREIEQGHILKVYNDCGKVGIPCWVKMLSGGENNKAGLSGMRQSPFAQGEAR